MENIIPSWFGSSDFQDIYCNSYSESGQRSLVSYNYEMTSANNHANLDQMTNNGRVSHDLRRTSHAVSILLSCIVISLTMVFTFEYKTQFPRILRNYHRNSVMPQITMDNGEFHAEHRIDFFPCRAF